MAMMPQLAIKGKRPRDTGGYRLLGHSLGELDRADFNRIFASLDVASRTPPLAPTRPCRG